MKKLLAVLIAALSITISAQGQLSGPLSGVLPGDSTYTVVGNISVQSGDSLIIEAGAMLIFNSGIQFDINGYLHAAGTETDSIKFINSPGLNFGGIDFNNSADDNSLLEYCLISGGLASGIYPNNSGGGIYCISSSPTISNCTISGNTATTVGGGIYCYYSSPSITNCAISGNTADYGGGIYCENSSSPAITNCTISGNTAEYQGGGIYCSSSSSPAITNCTISENTADYGGGIRCSSSSPEILNTIVSGNLGNYGVYLSSSSNTTITFSDFYNNENGNFYNPPQGIGIITTVNANGDSCDTYFNIFIDPLFYSTTGDSAYYLTAASPCIDAGDPASPLDPDSTIADMGAYYYDQSGGTPPVTVSLTPYNPPIIIPANGGTFDFNIAVANNDSITFTVDIWTMATLPNGNEYGPIIGPVNLTLNPGYSGNRDRTQNIPANAPAGLYTYDAYIGDYPNEILDEDHFDFEKLSTADASSYILDWNCWGEGFEGETVESYVPCENILHSPFPNPFNPSTVISFELKDAGEVSLIVYDIQGREVQSLVTSHLSLGYHEVVFDGTDLSSGMYFVRLTVNSGLSMVRKVVLMK
ncbi:right-handed parallel beta-helix repeat-containing protein [bacterium]|nr:right-handed parallel beta-helix repeat-containing protein [bacterium]